MRIKQETFLWLVDRVARVEAQVRGQSNYTHDLDWEQRRLAAAPEQIRGALHLLSWSRENAPAPPWAAEPSALKMQLEHLASDIADRSAANWDNWGRDVDAHRELARLIRERSATKAET